MPGFLNKSPLILGIVIRHKNRDGFAVINEVRELSWALDVGLKPNDLILEIDGNPTTQNSIPWIRTLLAGLYEGNTSFTLKIERDGRKGIVRFVPIYAYRPHKATEQQPEIIYSSQKRSVDAVEKRINPGATITNVMEKRWSPRAIVGPVPPKSTLLNILEAARWAPSAFNEQPWVFFIATADEPDEFQKALDCLVPGNKQWVKNAPVILFGITKNTFDREHAPNPTALFDLGLAVKICCWKQSITGWSPTPCPAFSSEAVRQIYDIPSGYDPRIAIALGHLGNPNPLKNRCSPWKNRNAAEKMLPILPLQKRGGNHSDNGAFQDAPRFHARHQ
jgi:Nitroreductase